MTAGTIHIKNPTRYNSVSTFYFIFIWNSTILIHCCILLEILCELYYNARIHEHQDHWDIISLNPDSIINTLNPELNPICYLLALLAHHFLHVSRIRVKSLTLGILMSYIYIYIYIYIYM